MSRTATRPSSGERLSTSPGGVGNGGEGCESSSANAQHYRGEGRESFPANAQHHEAAPSGTSSNMTADPANTLRQVLQMTNEGGPTAPTGTYEFRPIEIRQKNECLLCLEILREGKVLHQLSVFSEVMFFPGSRLKG